MNNTIVNQMVQAYAQIIYERVTPLEAENELLKNQVDQLNHEVMALQDHIAELENQITDLNSPAVVEEVPNLVIGTSWMLKTVPRKVKIVAINMTDKVKYAYEDTGNYFWETKCNFLARFTPL